MITSFILLIMIPPIHKYDYYPYAALIIQQKPDYKIILSDVFTEEIQMIWLFCSFQTTVIILYLYTHEDLHETLEKLPTETWNN